MVSTEIINRNETLLNADSMATADMIKKKEVSSLEITEVYINQLKHINPKINCLVEERFKEAIQEAQLADEQIQQEKNTSRGKLFGVPISIKECLDVKDMKTTGGISLLQNAIKSEDSAIAAKLKAEGAIILGKSNTPALCFYQETENKLFGRTNNPWDLTKTVGGSSGGEGALIAAGGAAVGIGSDIGGSIRFPSHFNGVIGFKSGKNQVSYTGGFPEITIPLQERMLGVGAMAKSVRDAELINEIISNSKPESKNLNHFEIIMPVYENTYPLSVRTRELMIQTKEFIEKTFTVHDEIPPYFNQSALLWQLIMSIDGAKSMAETAFGHKSPIILTEYMKEKLFKNANLPHFLTWALFGANLFKPNKKQLNELENTIMEGDEKLAKYLDNRLLILPVYHTGATKHGQVYKELFSIKKTYLKYMPYIAYANVWGLPSLTLPIGEDEYSMPISIQIISLTGNENAIFQLGTLLEKQFRGYKRAIL